MGKPTSITDRIPCARRGFTLVESMIASALLSVSVVAISGAISASYSQDEYARERQMALDSGSQLLDEVTALPFDAAVAGNPSIMGFSTYTDEAELNKLTSVVSATTQAVAPTFVPADPGSANIKKTKRQVTVKRRISPTGASSSTGDFAIVGVTVGEGDSEVVVSRLVTAAEAKATR